MSDNNKMSLGFHRGERILQARVGVEEKMADIGPRVIRDYMPEQHRSFFAQLPLLFIGGVDSSGDIWASVLNGEVGFVHSPEPKSLRVDAMPLPQDPLVDALKQGADMGLLGIELPTRRRNRMNAQIAAVDKQGFGLQVKQSFGNCPKYIQRRQAETNKRQTGAVRHDSKTLDTESLEIIQAADTLFVASGFDDGTGQANRGFDVSHRGGLPGFIHVQDQHSLWIPDYAGNNFFNTFGNLQLDPRAGILIPDFEQGQLLYLTGRAKVHWAEDCTLPVKGVPRALHFEAKRVVRIENAMALQWELEEYSPFAEQYSVDGI